MAGRKTRGKGKGKAPAAIPDVYQDMLADVMPTQVDVPERPLKKRRTGRRGNIQSSPVEPNNVDRNDEEDEDDVQFEDVLDLPKIRETNNDLDDNSEGFGLASNVKRQQTAYRDSDEESTEDGFDWDALDMGAKSRDDGPTGGDLELTLTRPAPSRKETLPRRRAITKVEKGLRIEIHKMHVLCLLAHLDRRNEWCNDSEVHKLLKPLLTKKILTFLRPKSSLSQFGRADSLKRGLNDVSIMWRTKFNITARGLRRSLWAEEEEHLHNYNLPADADPAFDKVDFIDAAMKLRGSRDLGAQLYCALLRSAGVDTRLVCSLQPLSFTGGGPSMPKPKSSTPAMKQPSSRTDTAETANIHSGNFGANVGGSSPAAPLSARRRLGHPNAADYHMPDVSAPIQPLPRQKPKEIIESPYPVFWVEVLDEAHQKWFPVDPLVTESVAKPRAFEPPLVDRENNMCYVIAFEEDGSARDVTKRYTKAFNAKTRKTRVESTDKGERWWRRAMKPYSRGWQSDLDQIEDTELAANEAREPMPKNVADFKDHPYYALERHLKRNEILVSTREVGKVAAGRDSTGVPGTKKLESIYRRRDVKVAKSADAWYRQGREVKIGEQPAKVVAARRKPDDDDELRDDMEESAGMNLYTEDQTELYIPPPIVNGRVPKNSFGNIDIYVPSMVPQGGTHLSYAEASRAARLLNIDYADALTGFEFRGRHGTAILKGIVVATEYAEAVQAVIEGFRDEQARAEEEMRTLAALRMWKRFLIGLRIKERVDAYEVEGEGEGEETTPARPESVRDKDDAENNDEDMESEDTEYIDDYGGGFIPE